MTRLALLFLPILCCAVASQDGAPAPSFNRDIRPLLADRCFACHGPDAEDRKADLRLDVPDGEHGALTPRDGVAAVVPGDLAASELWFRIAEADEGDRMPPADSHEQPFDEAQRALIRRWIESGAEYQTHWSFVPPSVAADAPRDLDGYVLRRLRAEGLEPAPEADKGTLIRRVTLDLTGLPPTSLEVTRFLADDSPLAWQRLVDRLLASPRYGEHMARYWLDLVRFADTNGIHHDHFRDSSPYRDWVIRAFNDNLPYDRFATDQIAGDLYPEPTTDQLIASGFHRLHLIIDVGTMLPEESLSRNVIDRTSAYGTAFLGLTLGCAVCHDHKFDPVTQADFFSLSAFFNNLDGAPETGGRSGPDFVRGLQPPYLEFPSEEQAARRTELEQQIASAERAVAEARAAESSAEGDAKATHEAARKAAEQRLGALRREFNQFRTTIPGAMVMRERAEPRPAHVLIRGQYDRPGAEVPRGTPAFLPPLETGDDLPTRMDLARWTVRPDHPLTARVMVNRTWQQFFGVGLVKTSEDLGSQGEVPSHPELLDFLARSFVRSGWDVKELVRRIVCSDTYKQASRAAPEAFASDPENRLLARGPRFRLDAEVIRDSMLSTSGLLEERLYGPSVKPPQPAGLWEAVALPDSYPRVHQTSPGRDAYRRSVYTFWKRGLPPPQMTIFDAPGRESCVARRERTNTPLQALLQFNEQQCVEAARHVATRACTEIAAPSNEYRIGWIYETVTSRPTDRDELRVLTALFEDLRDHYLADEAAARALLALDAEAASSPVAPPLAVHAALTVVANTIYNLDITRTKD